MNEKVFSKYESIPEVRRYFDRTRLDKSDNTVRAYVFSLDRFFDFVKPNTFADILAVNDVVCEEYQSKLIGEGLGESSVNGHFRNVKAFYNWLVEKRYIGVSPLKTVKGIKEPKRELAFLTEDEVKRIFEACKNVEEQTMIAFLVYLGLRRSELVNIKLSDISEDEIRIIGKGDKFRKVYMPQEVFALMEKHLFWRKHREFEYLFRSKMGGRYTTEAIRLKVKAIAKRAGIADERIDQITPHTFRRTLATYLDSKGISVRIIQGILGHANPETTMRYIKLNDEAVKAAMKGQHRA